MPARPTDYERVNVILPRDMKRAFIRYCEDNDISMTQVMRASIKKILEKREELCPSKKRMRV